MLGRDDAQEMNSLAGQSVSWKIQLSASIGSGALLMPLFNLLVLVVVVVVAIDEQDVARRRRQRLFTGSREPLPISIGQPAAASGAL